MRKQNRGHNGSMRFTAMIAGIVTAATLLVLSGCGGLASTITQLMNDTQTNAVGQAFANGAFSATTMTPSAYGSSQIIPKVAGQLLSQCGIYTKMPNTNNACASGSMSYNIDALYCTPASPDPTCCSDSSCTNYSRSIGGSGSLNFNSCSNTLSTGDVIVIGGDLTATVTSNLTYQCSGTTAVDVTITAAGTTNVTLNGKTLCQGNTSVTTTAHADPSSKTATVVGTICGRSINNDYQCGNGSCQKIN